MNGTDAGIAAMLIVMFGGSVALWLVGRGLRG